MVLDGIVADDLDFASYHKDHEEVAKTLFSACDADAFCKGKLPGRRLRQPLAALIPKLEAGHCPTSAKLTARTIATSFDGCSRSARRCCRPWSTASPAAMRPIRT